MGYQLILKAELSNVTDLQVEDSPESPFEYTFKIECIGCREVHSNPVTINCYEKHEISGSRGEASLVFRCRNCKKEHSANILRPKAAVLTAEDDEKVILDIDSRGLYFLDFEPSSGSFTLKGTKTTVFKEIDLSDGEWYDYDDDLSQEVSITEVQFEIKRS